jgi:hypothetical protein
VPRVANTRVTRGKTRIVRKLEGLWGLPETLFPGDSSMTGYRPEWQVRSTGGATNRSRISELDTTASGPPDQPDVSRCRAERDHHPPCPHGHSEQTGIRDRETKQRAMKMVNGHGRPRGPF